MPEAYKFPDEIEEEKKEPEKKEPEIEIELVDDTPEIDRGRRPLNKTAEEIAPDNDDEAKKYSEGVKKRIQELKHSWHDERRARESAERERNEAVTFAQRALTQANELKKYIHTGEATHKEVLTTSSEKQLAQARAALKVAYESGNADKVAEASEQLADARIAVERAKMFQPTPLTTQETQVSMPSPTPQPAAVSARPDDKALKWQGKNQWFGQDPEMTSFALGYHKKMVDSGVDPRTDDYYQKLDGRLREVFPDFFGEQKPNGSEPTKVVQRPANNVAPVSRTTGPKKVTLSLSQQSLARKLGLTPEQYAAEVIRLENRNG